MASTFSLQGKLGLDASDFVKGAKQAENAIGDVSTEMDDLPRKGGDAGAKAGGLLSSNLAKGFVLAGGATALAAGFKSVIDAASNLEESTNAVNVAFGDAGASVLAFGEDSAKAYGLSNRGFNEAAVGFSAFAETIAGSGGDTAKTLETLIARSTDFASVMNMDVTEAADAFRSALSGEAEPLKRFGINISDAAVTAYALEAGLVATAGAMTDGIKVQARYGLLMRETNKFAGDFANTSEGAANAQRVMSAEFENFQAAVGKHLLPQMAEYVGLATSLLETGTALAELRFGDAFDMPNLGQIGADLITNNLLMKPYLKVLNLVGVETDTVNEAARNAAVGFGLWGDTVAEVAEKAESAARINANEYSVSMDKVAAAISMAEHESQRFSESQDLVTGSIEDAKAALDAQTEAAKKARTANMQMADATFDLYDAEDALAAAIEDGTAVIEDSSSSLRDMRAASADVAQAADALATKQIELDGINRDTVVGQQMWNDKMMETAATLSGPMQTEVLAHIARVNGIPAEKITAILADTNPDNVAQVQAELDRLAGDRTSNLSVRVTAIDTTTGKIVPVGGVGYLAEGGPAKRGEPYIVGEKGPELFVPNVNGTVIPAAATAAMFATSAAAPRNTPIGSLQTHTAPNAGTGVVINHYGPNLTASDVSRGYTLARLAQV